MKFLPNVLSLARIPLSLSLVFIATLERPLLFVCVYVITASTDMFDGLIARKFDCQSTLGAKFDTFADAALILCMLIVVLGILRISFAPYVILGVVLIALNRVANLAITRVKFKQWGSLHTFLVRYSALPIYFVAPIYVWTGQPMNGLTVAILAVVLLSTLEETWIILTKNDYDMNIKSIWHAKNLSK